MYFLADGRSDCGRIRLHNEDTFRVDSARGLFVVADGMGGHAGVEVASALAVETVFKTLLGGKKAEHARMRHILIKSLGTQPGIEPDIAPIDVQSNDRFLLCSDGLSDLVDHNDLRTILAGNGTLAAITGRLIDKANEVGGRDNITAVVIDCYDNKWKFIMKSAINRIRR